MTDAIQPLPSPATSAACRPEGDPKADRRRYYLLGHGSHLVDTAPFLCGADRRRARQRVEKFGAYSWFVSVDFADGSHGSSRPHARGADGLARGLPRLRRARQRRRARPVNPWYFRVRPTSNASRPRTTPTTARSAPTASSSAARSGARRHDPRPARRMQGADVEDGLAAMRVLAAISRSVETGETRAGRRTSSARLIATRASSRRPSPGRRCEADVRRRARPRPRRDAVQPRGRRARLDAGRASPPTLADRMRTRRRARGLEIAAVSGTFNMAHPDPRCARAGLRRLEVLAARVRRARHRRHHALHGHARSRQHVAPARREHDDRGLARHAGHDRSRRSPSPSATSRCSRSSRSSATSSTARPPRAGCSTSSARPACGWCSTPRTCSSRRPARHLANSSAVLARGVRTAGRRHRARARQGRHRERLVRGGRPG